MYQQELALNFSASLQLLYYTRRLVAIENTNRIGLAFNTFGSMLTILKQKQKQKNTVQFKNKSYTALYFIFVLFKRSKLYTRRLNTLQTKTRTTSLSASFSSSSSLPPFSHFFQQENDNSLFCHIALHKNLLFIFFLQLSSSVGQHLSQFLCSITSGEARKFLDLGDNIQNNKKTEGGLLDALGSLNFLVCPLGRIQVFTSFFTMSLSAFAIYSKLSFSSKHGLFLLVLSGKLRR